MRHREEEALNGNLTAMIDVVFQLIIFFVCTQNLQDSAANTEIELPMAPNGIVESKKNPMTIYVDVDKKGNLSIVNVRMKQEMLVSILRKARSDNPGLELPVVIRADAEATHEYVKKVMDACSVAGIWKIKFAALKEKGD